MRLQKTKFDRFQRNITRSFFETYIGNWKIVSTRLIALLLGYYLGNNISVYYFEKTGQRPIAAIVLIIILESLIRVRSSIKADELPLLYKCLDNLRLGVIYAVVLEAFKLGS